MSICAPPMRGGTMIYSMLILFGQIIPPEA